MNTNALLLALSLAALGMAGCNGTTKQKSVAALDKELASANSADPAMTAALEDQIMIDPQLAARANAHSIRPPDEPFSAPLPPSERNAVTEDKTPATLGQKAYGASQSLGTGCNMAVRYSAIWATRLPADVPIYPQGHVREAAGSDTASCHLRVVSYSSAASAQEIGDYYASRGKQAGYVVEQSGDTVNAKRAKDNAMFAITIAKTKEGGTVIDVVSNAGR